MSKFLYSARKITKDQFACVRPTSDWGRLPSDDGQNLCSCTKLEEWLVLESCVPVS